MPAGAVAGTAVERAIQAFREDTLVHERLPGGGTVHIERMLPYVFVYRGRDGVEDAGTRRLLLGEASFIVAPGSNQAVVSELVRGLAAAATAELGSFLVLEVWAGEPDSTVFRVQGPSGPAAPVVAALERGLASITAPGVTGAGTLESEQRHPPGLEPLLTPRECWEIGCLSLGLEVPPVYRDAGNGRAYPVFLRRMRSMLSPVLRQAAYEFARTQTRVSPQSYRAYGPRHFGRALTHADQALSEIERSYPFLMLVAPINSSEAWIRFRDGGFEREPEFRYRLLPIDPDVLKRRLYALDFEDVADPAMAYLLHDKRTELDRQITMLAERGTPHFRLGSMKLYGTTGDDLLRTALDILSAIPVPESSHEPRVEAAEFAAAAEAELAFYREAAPSLASTVQVRPDITGLLVSNGNLMIGETLSLRSSRVEPLLQHEVGTHVLTYQNGRSQPLRMMRSGLADYDELQEGLGVFAEYMSAGLDASRMRTLAARVVAAHSVEQRASFIDTFRLLVAEHGLTRGSAFDITERVHQSGGFTRDLIYLRGLMELTAYLRDGGALEPLYSGKIARRHIEVVEELHMRGYLSAPALLPRFLARPGSPERLQAVRDGLPLTRMVD